MTGKRRTGVGVGGGLVTGGGGEVEEESGYVVSMVLKIADFGLSRSIGMNESQHQTKSIGVGTDCWMPPEGLKGSMQDDGGQLSFSYDLHPCGSVMFFALSGGQHAFPGTNETDINTNILKGKHIFEK